MNKKQIIISAIALTLVLVALVAVLIIKNKPSITPEENPKTQYKSYAWSYFDTVTTIQGYAHSEEEFDAVVKDIYAELDQYHKLYDIYNLYEGVSNLRTINKLYKGEHKVVTVDRKIIDMLLYAKDLYVKTNEFTVWVLSLDELQSPKAETISPHLAGVILTTKFVFANETGIVAVILLLPLLRAVGVWLNVPNISIYPPFHLR